MKSELAVAKLNVPEQSGKLTHAPESTTNSLFGAGQDGTHLRLKRDTFVPSYAPWSPQPFWAFEPCVAGVNVPIISINDNIPSCSLDGLVQTAAVTSTDAPDRTLDAFTVTRHGRAWAACIELCDRVERGELRVSDLVACYPAEWNSFRNMLQRERDLGRDVCDSWKEGRFMQLLRDKGPTSANRRTLDRVVNADPLYAPQTTKWSSKKEQTGNRSNTVIIYDAKDVGWNPEELSKKLKGRVKPDTIRKRKMRGWTDAELHANKRLPKPLIKEVQLPAQKSKIDAFDAAKAVPPKTDEKLADRWQHVMREITSSEPAPLTGKERGRLREFSVYLDACNRSSDKTGVLEFLLRNWHSACKYVCKAAGWSREPAVPCPMFLADKGRHFMDFVSANYKPIDVSTLQFNDDPVTVQATTSEAASQDGPTESPPHPQDWLADHPMTFEAYQRECWRDYRLMGTREQYEAEVNFWYNRLSKEVKPKLSCLPAFVQETIIRGKGLAVEVIDPPPANPNSPPKVFCPQTPEFIQADPVKHSDPFPGDEPSAPPAGPQNTLDDVSASPILAHSAAVSSPAAAAQTPVSAGPGLIIGRPSGPHTVSPSWDIL